MFCYLLFPLVLSSTGQGQDAPENDVTEHSTDEPTCVIAMEETPAPAPAVNEVDTNPASADVVDSNAIPGDSQETASGDEACFLFIASSFVVAYFSLANSMQEVVVGFSVHVHAKHKMP